MPSDNIPFPGLQWRVVVGFKDYRVFENGSIQRMVPNQRGRFGGLILRPVFNERYLKVRPCADGRQPMLTVHSVVLNAFIGPKPSPIHQGAHNDGDVFNNWLWNLRWATPQENAEDKQRHGTSGKGEDNPRSKLTWAKAAEIRSRLIAGEEGTVLAMEYGVGTSTIYHIKYGETWR